MWGGVGLLFFFSNMDALIHLFKKKKHLCFLCAKSYVWKPLRGFKQRSDMLFLTLEHETWLCFSPSTAFQCVLPDLSSSTFDNISRRSCRFPVMFSYKNSRLWSSHHGSVERNPTSIQEDAGLILTLFSGLRIQHCRELWRRSQMWLRSRVAVAGVQAGSDSSNSTPSLRTSICRRWGPKKHKKKKKKKKEQSTLTVDSFTGMKKPRRV